MLKIITVVGARPQFVKAATISREIQTFNELYGKELISEKIVHTGQHYDFNMSDVFFDEMEIPKPAYYLGIGSLSHGAMTGRQLEKIEEILLNEAPDCVLVYGDTNSTLAGALAGSKLHIPVVHIESGLRSNNMQMPEEINRILTDNVSNLLFCPSSAAKKNLINEGFGKKEHSKIVEVGDVMYDALLHYRGKMTKPVDLDVGSFILMTLHRAENTDNLTKLKEIVAAINEISETYNVVCPLHPRTQKILSDNGLALNATVTNPVGYFEMLWLIENSYLVMTDSGGLQKEAYFMEKLCITLRDQTEWQELVDSKVNYLVDIDREKITRLVEKVVAKEVDFSLVSDLYGNGKSASMIVQTIYKEFK